MKKILFVIISFFAFFFFFGCSQFIEDYAEAYKEKLDPSNKLALLDYDKIERCENSSCVCFVCDSKKGIYEYVSGVLYNTSWRVLYGNCTFEKECNETKFMDYFGSDKKEIRMFMIGQGTTFTDFNDANPYCKDRLNLAVKWLFPLSPTDHYQLPKKERASCFLNYGVMPLYILYSGGNDVNIERAGEIAEELKGIGPVIITTEIDFNSSDDAVLANISQQIDEIDRGCTEGGKRNCIIALAPRMGDYDGVNKFAKQYKDSFEKVDIIAYGINTRYSHKCDNPAALFSEAINFSQFTLYNYSKPSLVAYMLLEPGPNINGTCNWTEVGVADTYKYFFPYALPAFIKRGVIGVALYRFNSTEDPLNCSACRVATNQEYLRNWFGFCQKYKTDAQQLPTGDMLVVFPNASSGHCMFASNLQYYTNLAFSSVGSTGPQFGEVAVPDLEPKNDTLFRCDWCVNNETDWPEDLYIPIALPPSSDYCTKYPELDYYADLRDLDPMLVRAVAWTESSMSHCAFNPNAVSYNSTACNPRNLRNWLNDNEKDENGNVLFEKPFIKDPTGNCSDVENKRSSPGRKFCAYGLMQTIIYPGYVFDYYEGKGITISQDDYKILKNCFENASIFNPFNASHSACVGTWELNMHLQWALDVVKQNGTAAALNLLDENGQPDKNKVRIVATYLALLAYNRGQSGARAVFDEWVDEFANQTDADPSQCEGEDTDPPYCSGENRLAPCYGYKNFFKYVEDCIWGPSEEKKQAEDPNYKVEPNYPYLVLSRYRGLVKSCVGVQRTGCPPDVYIKQALVNGKGTLPKASSQSSPPKK
jgi:hypothetical protein